ncbi:hypothetical protein HDU86_003444 [Geranomyces michiganensis]|nr:hypothetical protein HDU86_003444 [Geranomyces michiganensis]
MSHMFPEHSSTGSSRSDFSAMTVDADGEAFPFLIAEFEVNGFKIHKDYLVAASEGAHELNAIVGRLCESPADLDRARMFVAMVSDTTISFVEIRPAIVNGKIFFTERAHARTFNLGHPNLKARLADTLALIAFLRGPVADAGKAIADLATFSPRTYPYAALLPELPKTVAQYRSCTTHFTPAKDSDKKSTSAWDLPGFGFTELHTKLKSWKRQVESPQSLIHMYRERLWEAVYLEGVRKLHSAWFQLGYVAPDSVVAVSGVSAGISMTAMVLKDSHRKRGGDTKWCIGVFVPYYTCHIEQLKTVFGREVEIVYISLADDFSFNFAVLEKVRSGAAQNKPNFLLTSPIQQVMGTLNAVIFTNPGKPSGHVLMSSEAEYAFKQVNRVLPPLPAMLDLNMFNLLHGKERGVDDFKQLLTSSGFEFKAFHDRATAAGTSPGYIVARAATEDDGWMGQEEESEGNQIRSPENYIGYLLRHLASEPGVLAVMRERKWTAAILGEYDKTRDKEDLMDGNHIPCWGFHKTLKSKVTKGEIAKSEIVEGGERHKIYVCLFNPTTENQGNAHMSFVRYEGIMVTLMHELAHFVHLEHHDESFNLCKELTDEAMAFELSFIEIKDSIRNGIKSNNKGGVAAKCLSQLSEIMVGYLVGLPIVSLTIRC